MILTRFAFIPRDFIFALFAACSCQHPSRVAQSVGTHVVTRMSLKEYAHTNALVRSNDTNAFFFPQLRLYNPQGQLIYQGDDAADNARIFSRVPELLSTLAPLAKSSSLDSVLHTIPITQLYYDQIRNHHHTVMLSIGIDVCEGCNEQSGALEQEEARLLRSSVDIVEIRIYRQ